MNEKDEIIFLFDNCTDGTYKKFKEVESFLPSKPKVLITQDDLYEVKANNLILKEATNDTIILFQDDIINHDKALKHKVFQMIETFGDKLGLLGGRSGYELTSDLSFPEKGIMRVSNWEHLDKQYGKRLSPGGFEKRTFLNRGPIVFTRDLLNEVGYLDEEFAPLWGDDLDYCARAKYKHGRDNYVFQCDVESNLKWGATHSGKSKVNFDPVVRKNWKLFTDRWGDDIKKTI